MLTVLVLEDTVQLAYPDITNPLVVVVPLSFISMALFCTLVMVFAADRSGPLTTAQTVLLPVVVLMLMLPVLFPASTYEFSAPDESKTSTCTLFTAVS